MRALRGFPPSALRLGVVVLEAQPLLGVAGEEGLGLGLGLGPHEELRSMHEPVPTFHDRRYLGCGEVLQGPEEVPLMPGMVTKVPGRAEMATEVPGTATALA